MHVGDSNVKGIMGSGKWLFFKFSFLLTVSPYPFFYLSCFYALSPKPGVKELRQDKALCLLRVQDVHWSRSATQLNPERRGREVEDKTSLLSSFRLVSVTTELTLAENSQVQVEWHLSFLWTTHLRVYVFKGYLGDNSPESYKLFHLPSLPSSCPLEIYHHQGQGGQIPKYDAVFGTLLPAVSVCSSQVCSPERKKYEESIHMTIN